MKFWQFPDTISFNNCDKDPIFISIKRQISKQVSIRYQVSDETQLSDQIPVQLLTLSIRHQIPQIQFLKYKTYHDSSTRYNMNIRGYQYQVSSITNLENIKYQVSAYKQYESKTFIGLKLSV